MQIMNLKKLVKNLWWALTAFKTINDLPDSIIFIDSDGFIKRANKKSFDWFGFTLEDGNFVKIDDFITDGLASVLDSIKYQKPILTKAFISGKESYIELNSVRCGGNGYCITIRDITRLTTERLLEDKIAKFNGEKNAMLVKLASEFTSPITSISGFSQGLLDGLGGELSEKQAKYIKIINSNSNDLHHFMDKFLEFTYVESSLYESMYQNFDMVEALKAIIKDFEIPLNNKKLVFDFDYDSAEKRTVYSDLKALQKIFRNILEVALDMTDSGYISVKLRPADEKTAMRFGVVSQESLKGFVHLTIKDTGVGVPEEEMKYLCEPYAQLENGKKNFLRSLKLGTATILAKRAKGSIFISSEVMKGTIYDIVLPVEKVINE